MEARVPIKRTGWAHSWFMAPRCGEGSVIRWFASRLVTEGRAPCFAMVLLDRPHELVHLLSRRVVWAETLRSSVQNKHLNGSNGLFVFSL